MVQPKSSPSCNHFQPMKTYLWTVFLIIKNPQDILIYADRVLSAMWKRTVSRQISYLLLLIKTLVQLMNTHSRMSSTTINTLKANILWSCNTTVWIVRCSSFDNIHIDLKQNMSPSKGCARNLCHLHKNCIWFTEPFSLPLLRTDRKWRKKIWWLVYAQQWRW